MLKKLHIINFESHKDTTIQFSNGFNVFQGQSDGGKSAIIRAIAAVCYNKWSNESVRLGQKETVIQLTTDLGVVKLTKNPKEKINSYTCKKFDTNQQFVYQTVGITVPDVVYQITGMRQLNVGDSVTDIPNIMFQLEKHYMLAQVSGKSCTSNLIARIFDKVIGLGGMEQLINSISSSMINDKKQVTKNMSQIDQLKLKMTDQDEIKEKQNKLNEIKQLKKQIENLNGNIFKISQIVRLKQKYTEKIEQLDLNAIQFDAENAKKIINQILIKKQEYSNIVRMIQIKNKYNNDLLNAENLINKYKNLDQKELQDIKNLCNKIYISDRILKQTEQKKNKLQISQKILNNLKNVDKSLDILNQLKQQCNTVYKMNKIIQKYNTNNSKVKDIKEKICKYEENYIQNLKKLNDLKQQKKICPLCGNPFNKCKDI